jgi:hypothetical protein
MPSWSVLKLHSYQLPVSKFPEWAETYVCDQCGADLTRFVCKVLSGHGGKPIGPETCTCDCGRTYKTGYVEWDHLTFEEQEHESAGLLPLWLMVSIGFAIVGIPADVLTFAFLGNWKAGFFGSLLAGTVLVLFLRLRFRAKITASRRRTRSF